MGKIFSYVLISNTIKGREETDYTIFVLELKGELILLVLKEFL